MTSAVITYCGHFFHGNCLRKWLYVQETCPMCHTPIKPSTSIPTPAAGDAQPNPVQTQPHPPEQEPAAEGEQAPVQDEVHLPDKQSVSESLSKRQGLLNCVASGDSAGPSCSLGSGPCTERDWESEQRTNQPREANSALDSDREPWLCHSVFQWYLWSQKKKTSKIGSLEHYREPVGHCLSEIRVTKTTTQFSGGMKLLLILSSMCWYLLITALLQAIQNVMFVMATILLQMWWGWLSFKEG